VSSLPREGSARVFQGVQACWPEHETLFDRMEHAVKGHGGTVRLVMLPEESHGHRARESALHTPAEMTDWFDRWLVAEPQS